jgi:16S rRNA processing protein RimM
MEDYIINGRIIGAHGIRWELKVVPLTDDTRRFLKMKDCYLCGPNLEDLTPAKAKSARIDKTNVLLKLEGVEDRDKAESLKGTYIAVSRADAVPLKKDSYYIADLIGLDISDDERGPLGKVCDCYETGANYILEIKRDKPKNLLLPFLKQFCYEVNVEEGYIKCRLPEGLYELYE